MNILLLSNDIEMKEQLCNWLQEKNKNFNIISTYSCGLDFIKLVKIDEIDIMLLDLSLYKVEEIDVLKSIINNVRIIIIDNKEKRYERKKLLDNIHKVFLKPINNFEIFQCIEELYIKMKTLSDIKCNVSKTLLSLGFNINNIGTKYLIEAIIFSINNSRIRTLKDTYLYVANKYSIDYMLIKWSIENSLNRFNNTVDENKIQQFFNINDNRKLTPKYIINYFKMYY